MKTSRTLISLLALWLAGPAMVSVYAAPPQYTFTTIDPPAELGAFASAFGNNNAGVVVGNFVTVDESLAGFIVQKGIFTEVTVPGAAPDNLGALNDVNDHGDAVGSFSDGDTGIGHSFIRSKDGTFTVLPDAAPDAVVTEATGINNQGDVVGFYLDASFAAHGFILSKGVLTTYNYPGGTRTLLTHINDRGQITGIRRDSDGVRRGFVLQGGVTTNIEVPGALNTRAHSINNLGQVVGYYDDSDLVAHGFLFKDGVYTTIDFPDAADTALLDINDRGEIAGTYDEFSHGLVATPGK